MRQICPVCELEYDERTEREHKEPCVACLREGHPACDCPLPYGT